MLITQFKIQNDQCIEVLCVPLLVLFSLLPQGHQYPQPGVLYLRMAQSFAICMYP